MFFTCPVGLGHKLPIGWQFSLHISGDVKTVVAFFWRRTHNSFSHSHVQPKYLSAWPLRNWRGEHKRSDWDVYRYKIQIVLTFPQRWMLQWPIELYKRLKSSWWTKFAFKRENISSLFALTTATELQVTFSWSLCITEIGDYSNHHTAQVFIAWINLQILSGLPQAW